jgi:hypothetical protein
VTEDDKPNGRAGVGARAALAAGLIGIISAALGHSVSLVVSLAICVVVGVGIRFLFGARSGT